MVENRIPAPVVEMEIRRKNSIPGAENHYRNITRFGVLKGTQKAMSIGKI